MGFMTSLTTLVLQTAQIDVGLHVHHKAPVTWPILCYLIHPQEDWFSIH